MANTTMLREAYAGKISAAKELGSKYNEGGMPAEIVSQIETLLSEAKGLQTQLDQGLVIENAEKYLNEPESTKAAHHDWNREALPNEGVIDGVAFKGADLFGTNRAGEAKLKLLGSGDYKDAQNAYLRSYGDYRRMSPDHLKVLQEGQDTAGGFWVGVDARSELVKKMATVTGVGRDVKTYQTGKDVISFPKVVYTTDDKYTAGTRISWTAESPAADISEATNPVSGEINIPIHTATCAVILTRAMIEDGDFDILGYVTDIIGEAFALGENDVVINGTGSGRPQGIMTHANATVAHASGGMLVLSGAANAMAWGTGGTTGIFAAEAALPPQYEAGAKWYANKATYSAIRALNATTAGFQWAAVDSFPNLANGYAPSLLGYPIVKDQFLADIGDGAVPMIFGDLSGYYKPERVGVSIEVLREVRALRDQVVVYARRRVGGQLVHDWKVKVLESDNS
jgi:HK97 family phage major capsid protein